MATVKILRTVKGSEDGLNVTTFEAGQVYTVSEDLMMQFFEMGAVEQLDIDAPAPAANDDAGEPAPSDAKKSSKKSK